MGKKQINVGLLGLGTIGTGVVRYFYHNQQMIDQKAGVPIRLVKAADQYSKKERAFDVTRLKSLKVIYQDRMQEVAWRQVVEDPEMDIIIEVMGSDASQPSITEALWRGKSVVTANKKVISQVGGDLLRQAKERGVALRFEAAVGGGTPLIQPLDECLAGSDIRELVGIINGTTNFILSRMTNDGCDYAQSLAEAQKRGLAEANPTEDVAGEDARSKLKILVRAAFGVDFPRSAIYCEGIAKQAGSVPVVTSLDIAYAKKLRHVIKLLAVAKRQGNGIAAWVQPMLIPERHPLATVDYTSNAVLIRKFLDKEAVDEVIFYGIGAGAAPTASAIVADVIYIANKITRGSGTVGLGSYYEEFAEAPPVSIDELPFKYYLRLTGSGSTEVLAKVVECLAETGIEIVSIESERSSAGPTEETFMVVGPTSHRLMDLAKRNILARTRATEVTSAITCFPFFE